MTLMMNSQDINRGNWMRYIQPARHIREQNLEMVQHERSIYYHVMQDLEPGTELLVWYGDQYTLYMGIPLHQSGSMGKPRYGFSVYYREAKSDKLELPYYAT